MHRIVFGVFVTGMVALWTRAPATGEDSPAADQRVGAVVGIERFPTETRAARQILYEHGFVVTAETKPYIHLFYRGLSEEAVRVLSDPSMSPGRKQERLAKIVLPPFVTTDVMLHAYFTLFSDELRRLEQQHASRLKALLRSWWSVSNMFMIDVEPLQDEWSRARGILAVALRLVEPDWKDETSSLPTWVDEEVKRVLEAKDRLHSTAWDRQVEYSAFRPRGFYTADRELERYFRAMVWLSRFPFRLDKQHEVHTAALMAVFLPIRTDYVNMVDAHCLLLGDPEGQDLSVLAHTISEVIPEAILPSPNAEALRRGLGKVLAELKKSKPGTIRTGDTLEEILEADEPPGIHIFPPLYVYDSEILTLTTQGALAERLPGGLDVMAALGSHVAFDLLIDCTPERIRPVLAKQIDIAKNKQDSDSAMSEVSALTYEVFQALTTPVTRGNVPPFMRTDVYKRKLLQTALAGWTEYRHNWVLHAKRTSVYGADEFPPVGFVEPNPEFWDALLRLTVATRDAFVSASRETDAPRWNSLATAVVRCRLITEHVLADQPMTRSDREFLMRFGDTLANLLKFESVLNTPEGTQAVVTDLAYDVLNRQIVHVGTGLPQAIYAIMPYRGKQWLCKGGVMTYREYVTEEGRTLTDEDWHAMLTSDKPPPQPEWTKDFCLPPEVKKREQP